MSDDLWLGVFAGTGLTLATVIGTGFVVDHVIKTAQFPDPCFRRCDRAFDAGSLDQKVQCMQKCVDLKTVQASTQIPSFLKYCMGRCKFQSDEPECIRKCIDMNEAYVAQVRKQASLPLVL